MDELLTNKQIQERLRDADSRIEDLINRVELVAAEPDDDMPGLDDQASGGTFHLGGESTLQLDAAFSHRTLANGTDFAAGDREDRHKTEAQLVQGGIGAGFAPDSEYSIDNQTSDKAGWVTTRVTGVGFDTSNGNWVLQFQDFEYDVNGSQVSESKTLYTNIIVSVDCS